MKELILNNSELLTTELQSNLEKNTSTNLFHLEGFYSVPYGRGTRKNQLLLTVVKQGEYTVNVRFNTDDMQYISSDSLGKTGKHEQLMIDCDMIVLFNRQVATQINELLESEKDATESA